MPASNPSRNSRPELIAEDGSFRRVLYPGTGPTRKAGPRARGKRSDDMAPATGRCAGRHAPPRRIRIASGPTVPIHARRGSQRAWEHGQEWEPRKPFDIYLV